MCGRGDGVVRPGVAVAVRRSQILVDGASQLIDVDGTNVRARRRWVVSPSAGQLILLWLRQRQGGHPAGGAAWFPPSNFPHGALSPASQRIDRANIQYEAILTKRSDVPDLWDPRPESCEEVRLGDDETRDVQ